MKIDLRNIGAGEMVEINYQEDGAKITETLTRATEVLDLIEELQNVQSELFWYLGKMNKKYD